MLNDMNLSTNPANWRFNRVDGGTEFGVTVTASTGYGDMAFSFEVMDADSAKFAVDYGFPQNIVEIAMKILNAP